MHFAKVLRTALVAWLRLKASESYLGSVKQL